MQNSNGNNGDRLITKTGMLISTIMGILIGVFGIMFLNSASEGKLPFTNTSSSHAYGYVKDGMYVTKSTNSEGAVRFIGILLLIMAVALVIDGITKLSIFNKCGVDAMPVSQMKDIIRTNRQARKNSSMQNLYNKGSRPTNNRTQNTNSNSKQSHSQPNASDFSGLFGAKNNAANGTASNNNTSGVIIECPACKQKLRFPTGKGQIEVTCNRCKYAFFTRT